MGAHVDHQGGEILGRAIDAYTILVFTPEEGSQVRLRSINYPGEVSFQLESIGRSEVGEWGRYARGAATILADNYGIRRGMQGIVSGSLPASGLSSSASIGLAFLHGLASANSLKVDPWEYIELDRQLENNYLRLDNGIQDQAMIALARPDSFVHLDASKKSVTFVRDHLRATDYCFLIAFSGFPRDLISTGLNDRVAECRQAARLLGSLGGVPQAEILADISEDIYQTYLTELPPVLQRRANHYFGEVRRVREGRVAWKQGNIQAFGQLMTASCESSINNYKSGTKEIIALHEIIIRTPGVVGGRFSGGGYGGCGIGLVKKTDARSAAESIRAAFARRYPDKEKVIKVYLAGFAGGARHEPGTVRG